MSHYRGGFCPFNDPSRRSWQDPEAILTTIGVKAGMTLADIGCGGGFFALPAARAVGEKGTIYGVDASAASIAALKEQAAAEGLKNLHLAIGRAEDTVFCQHCTDIVFMGIDLHDFQNPAKVLENAKIMLKPSGRLADLDWKPEAPFGPPPEIRFSPEKATRLINAAGFRVESTSDSGLYHYLIIARPA